MRLLIVSFVAFGTVLLCSTSAAAQLSGSCFDATMGSWSPIVGTHSGDRPPARAPDQSGDSMFYAFPPRILLSADSPRGGGDGWSRVEVPQGALPVPKPFMGWRAEEDSLWVGMGDGFTSTSSALARGQDAWEGVLRTRSDNLGSQLYSRPITLRETDCESPPPVPASADAPAPRVVLSSAGPHIALGETVPDVYQLQPVRSFEMVMGLVLDSYWVGSDSVLIHRNEDGLISEIDIRYPEGFDPSALRAGLLEEFGPGQPDAPWLSWWNRSTRSILQTGGRIRVLLIDPRMRY
jgi:hypothetical protein